MFVPRKCICVCLSLFLMIPSVGAAEVTLSVKKRYLNIPISHQSERRKLTFRAEGVDDLTVVARLAEGSPDYWVFKDLSAYMGKKLTVHYEGADEALAGIYQSDTIVGESRMYREENRPQFHFTTRRGWINDPNGLVFHNGEYHLFYQHNPYEREWENMHWGHAVSKDLLHWTELNDALYPDAMGTMFSGSAVVDVENTSGFGSKENPPLVVAYTIDGKYETQAIAYSLNNGRTLKKYEGNPVIDSHQKWQTRDTRDPRVFWYAPGRHWVMVLNERNGHSIYTSSDLKKWEYQSHVTGFWECPDLIELAVDGNPANRKWVMYGASSTYMIGDFDGKTFTPTSGKHRYTAGKIYAAQTFTGMPDGRKVQVGWGRIAHPGMPFNGMMLLPTELSLKTTRDGVRMVSWPIDEIKELFQQKYSSQRMMTETEVNRVLKENAGEDELLHVSAKLHLSYATSAGLRLDNQNIVEYDLNHNTINGWFYSPQNPTSMSLDIDVYVDRTSVEVFVDGGLFSYSLERRLDGEKRGMVFWGTDIAVSDVRMDRIKSIWE